MANMIDYVRSFGNVSFSAAPFNEIDGVILSQLAYLNFECLNDSNIRTLKRLNNIKTVQEIVKGTWNPTANLDLVIALSSSNRFKNISWSDWKTRLDHKSEEQFSAVTFLIDNQLYFISYRGTTATTIDWKEDLNMTFMDAIPSQKSALRYFNEISSKYRGNFILGGHSKGGNLAAYVVTHSSNDNKHRIIHAFSVDGPGLNEPISGFDRQIIRKLIPEASIIGLLLEPETNYQVVESLAKGFKQHDPFSWNVYQNQFVTLTSVNELSDHTHNSVNRWLNSLDEQTRQEFLDSLFALFKETNSIKFSELSQDWQQTLKLLITELGDVDLETKNNWRFVTNQLVSSFATEFKYSIRSDLQNKQSALIAKVKQTHPFK